MSTNSPGTGPTGATADERTDKPDIIVLANPFKRGDKVRLPAGTLFISMHPADVGLQASKRANTVTLHDASEAVVANSYHEPDKWEVAQPILLTTGTGSYWKRYVLTEAVLAANDIQPTHLTYRYAHGRYSSV